MEFDTLSMIKEILPYYGWLDDSCRLLKMVNKKANEIWSNSYYRMSKRFKRKNVMINAENKNQLVEYSLSNQMILTLFKSEILEIDMKEKYEWFIELLEGVEDPKMLQLSVGLSISNSRKTDITMFSYQECIKDKDFWYLELYNTVIETIERKSISIGIVNSFVYIDDISQVGGIKYIKSIVVQCLKEGEFTCEVIIKQLIELTKSKEIKFKDIKLVWYSINFLWFYWIVYSLTY